jgi:hypothetical protein
MTLLFICHECRSPIHGEFIIDDGIRWHKDKTECSRLKALVNNPFVVAATELGRTVAEKNTAYGSAFAKSGEFLKLLYPDGISPDQYTDMLLLVRIFDKQMRIATDKRALGESPFRDIAGYGILGVVKDA